MEKEISSGTMLGVVLIALAAVIGLGFGVFSIAEGVAGGEYIPPETIETVSKPILISLVSKLAVIFGVCSIGEFIFLKHTNDKLKIWDNSKNEHENIISECDIDIYEDSAQVRIPKKISLWKAIRCKLSDVASLQAIGFGNVKTVNIVGKVETHGNFYVIGNNKLARGLILLEEGSDVNIRIKTKVNVESALGIYRIYDVV